MASKGSSKGMLDATTLPTLCMTCLGEDSQIRMMVDRYGQECKVCTRPFTTYRWCPGPRMRYKRTEICQTCSRAKNVCQTCLLDLSYNLPVAVRDNLLQIKSDVPKTDVNREYHAQILAKQMEGKTEDELGRPFNLALEGPSSLIPAKDLPPGAKTLARLARRAPYYKRNLPHICSFWLKGECKRGDECPYRHEKLNDSDGSLSKQNIKDRYHGYKDPVARKILAKVASEAKKEETKVEPTEFVE